ncbi:hypothetical protein WN48_06453 [Eufriesea mexicana]|uniref:Uncharacterized protein n=1 Tax=Eufriesea mexicana TaxID=516756 RepID=A0A310SJP4_9HYME|nr:hypothetical protein WN48_06453 [Eufriesea mexicana]
MENKEITKECLVAKTSRHVTYTYAMLVGLTERGQSLLVMWRCARLRETRLPLNFSPVVAALSRRDRRKNRRDEDEGVAARNACTVPDGDVIKSWPERGHETRTITIPRTEDVASGEGTKAGIYAGREGGSCVFDFPPAGGTVSHGQGRRPSFVHSTSP